MDRELWKLIYCSLRRVARLVEAEHRARHRRRPRYSDVLIVAMYIWSVWHDRPLCWACDRSHYGSLFRPPRQLPSVSQFTRRIKSESCQRILQLLHDQLAGRGVMTDAGYIDGKPLLVSPVSKDRQATRGKICGGFAKGYKLHAFVNRRRRIVAWSVTGLNVAEQTVALPLLEYLPPLSAEALVMTDSNYDSAPLHKRAWSLGIPLINPLKGQQRVGEKGHHAVTLRQMGPARRALLSLWQTHPRLMSFVLKTRNEIERVLGVLVCSGGGLASLPAWVRGLDRVRRWVGVKIILYNAKLEAQDRLQKAPTAASAAASDPVAA